MQLIKTQLIENINQIDAPFKNAVITIGNFDGVHLGHQSLFDAVKKKAAQMKGAAAVMTFAPHPLKALGMSVPPLITRRDQKIELIGACGLDVLLCLRFNRAFAGISAHDFIESILVKKIGVKAIIIGEDYAFGKNRSGNVELLKKEGQRLGFETLVSPVINDSDTGKERISSTRIREIVRNGKVHQAQKYLGRHYQIRGKVIKGRKQGGSQLGFPTANIKLHDALCPKPGVYAVTVETTKGNFWGVANIGFSPTFGDQMFAIEVHILDFDHDIYGARLRVNMVERIRDEKKFSGIAKLSDQIRQDIDMAKDILAENGDFRHINLS